MNEVAGDVEGQAKVVRINVDQHGALGARFGVRSIPALLVFKNGRMVEELMPGADLRERLLAHAP